MNNENRLKHAEVVITMVKNKYEQIRLKVSVNQITYMIWNVTSRSNFLHITEEMKQEIDMFTMKH